MQPDRPQPALTRATAPTAFALRNIADRKARGRLRAAATVEAFGNEVAWTDAEGWRYELEAPPRVTIAAKDNERAAATVDLKVWDATGTLIFRDRVHAWDGFPVLVPDGTQHEEDDGLGRKIRRDNFRESLLEAARSDLAHTVRVVTKSGPWVKAKPGTVSTFYGTNQQFLECNSATYADARSGAGALSAPSSNAYTLMGQMKSGATYYVWEAFEDFDTSAIADTDEVSAATLSLYITADLSATDFTMEARLYDWGAAVTTGDWVAGASLGSQTLLASLTTVGVTASAYNEFADTAFPANVNLAGVTRIVVNSANQTNNTAPTGQERMQYANGGTADTTSDPKLVVTHAAASVPFRRALLGVGF